MVDKVELGKQLNLGGRGLQNLYSAVRFRPAPPTFLTSTPIFPASNRSNPFGPPGPRSVHFRPKLDGLYAKKCSNSGSLFRHSSLFENRRHG